jgi:hypothetical protein
MCAVLSPQVRNSLVIHAVADAPTGPFQMTDIALPSVHTNPQIMRTPDGDWLLYSQVENPPLATKNLLEDTDGLRSRGGDAIHQCLLDAVAL